MNANNEYHETRIPYDEKRTVLWKALVDHYFSQLVSRDQTVLEIGAGYCDFINNIPTEKKIAIDLWDEMPSYAADGVNTIVGDVEEIAQLEDNSVDFAFASNIFEHIEVDKLGKLLDILNTKLKSGGVICALQPNYRLAYKEYFDDYTHVSIWSDQSLSDFFAIKGYQVEKVIPGFLPLSIKSRLPVSPLLIQIYLKLPFKPMAKQMLVMASKK